MNTKKRFYIWNFHSNLHVRISQFNHFTDKKDVLKNDVVFHLVICYDVGRLLKQCAMSAKIVFSIFLKVILNVEPGQYGGIEVIERENTTIKVKFLRNECFYIL